MRTLMALLSLMMAVIVEQEGSDIDWNLSMNLIGIILQRFLLRSTQNNNVRIHYRGWCLAPCSEGRYGCRIHSVMDVLTRKFQQT